ncbi:expressed unknown protein [Seminavis robusta]|uniref:Uncharacterized protein n=1 Tax=Seminavis robusta TaxID=568900 RepID=A0A9N8EMX9_9STRA|nr:expressed unknown protein [Seminavis robusta]|eukprot:Sro1285_g259340.1 n/a (581) ;mRNA; f:16246-17988
MQQPAAGVQQPPQVQPFTAVQQPAAGVQQPPPQDQPFTAVQQPVAGVQQPPPQDQPFAAMQQPAAGVQQPPHFPPLAAVQQTATGECSGLHQSHHWSSAAACTRRAAACKRSTATCTGSATAAAAQQPQPVPPFAGMQQPSGGQPHSFHQPPGLQYPFAAPPPTTFGSPAAAAAGPSVWGTYAPPPPGPPAGPAPDPSVWGPRPPAPPGPPVAPTWWPLQPAYGPGFPPGAPLQETPGASKDTAMYTIIMPTLCALMGFTFIPADPVQQGMPSFLPQLAQASAKGPGLMALFRNGIQSLTSSPDNNTFFQGFNVSPTLHKELQSFQYSIDDPQTDWHKGLGPGVAMSRDRQAVLDRKRLYEQINTFGGMGITMGRLGDTKLETPTPSLPRTYQEFLFFLTRYGKILLTWLTPNCALYRLVAALSTEVLNYNRHATYPDHWYWENGPFILWKLVLEAKNFFDQSRSHETFLLLGPIRFATEPHLAARDLIRDAKTGLSQTELPGPFQQLLNYSVPSRPTPPVHFNPGGQMAPPVQPSPARQAPPAQASGPPSPQLLPIDSQGYEMELHQPPADAIPMQLRF